MVLVVVLVLVLVVVVVLVLVLVLVLVVVLVLVLVLCIRPPTKKTHNLLVIKDMAPPGSTVNCSEKESRSQKNLRKNND